MPKLVKLYRQILEETNGKQKSTIEEELRNEMAKIGVEFEEDGFKVELHQTPCVPNVGFCLSVNQSDDDSGPRLKIFGIYDVDHETTLISVSLSELVDSNLSRVENRDMRSGWHPEKFYDDLVTLIRTTFKLTAKVEEPTDQENFKDFFTEMFDGFLTDMSTQVEEISQVTMAEGQKLIDSLKSLSDDIMKKR